jgi:ATP sulfurylase
LRRQVTLGDRHLYDIEMLLNGAFSPLVGFMNKKT